MYSALSLSEFGPMEQKWMWKIEKDPVPVLIRNFMKDFQCNLELEMKKREKQSSVGLTRHLLDLMKEIICLRQHLWLILEQMEFQLNAVRALGRSFVAPIRNSVSDADDQFSPSNFNLKVEGGPKDIHKDRAEKDSGYFVAKMIRNQNWKRRDLQPTFRKGKDPINPKGMIEEAVVRLDNLISKEARLYEKFQNHGDGQLEESYFSQLDLANEKKLAAESSEDVWQKKHNTSVSDGTKEGSSESKIPRRGEEDADSQTMILKDPYETPFKSLINELHTEWRTREVWSLIKEDMYGNLMKEMENEECKKIGSEKIEAKIRENLYYTVFSQAIKDLLSSLHDSTLNKERLAKEAYGNLVNEIVNEESKKLQKYKSDAKIREDVYFTVLSEAIKDLLISLHDAAVNEVSLKKEDMYKNLIKEITNEENKKIESCKIDAKIREDVYYKVFSKATEDLLSSLHDVALEDHHSYEAKNQRLQDALSDEKLMADLRDDVYTTILREMYKEWKESIEINNDEGLFRQEMNRIVFSATIKDVVSNANCTLHEFQRIRVPENSKYKINEKLAVISSRLENFKLQLHPLVQHATLLRRKESLYRTAFTKRCENLQRAEAEVDVLGDQVDKLTGLLKKTYLTLHQQSPFLKSSEVLEILKLIKQEVLV